MENGSGNLELYQKWGYEFSCAFERLKNNLDRRSKKEEESKKGSKLFHLASQPCDLYWMDGTFKQACVSR